MSNVQARRAVATAIDKQDIANGLFPGVAKAALECTAATVPVSGFENAIPRPVTGRRRRRWRPGPDSTSPCG